MAEAIGRKKPPAGYSLRLLGRIVNANRHSRQNMP